MNIQRLLTLSLVFLIVWMQPVTGYLVTGREAELPPSRPAFFPSPGQAVTTCGGILLAAADTWISTEAPDTPLGKSLQLGVVRRGATQARTLVAFDLDNTVPPTATLLNATLELPIHETGELLPYQVDVYSLHQAWGEDDVTWNNQPPLGAEYGSVSSQLTSGSLYIDITALALHWLSGVVSPSLVLAPGSEMAIYFNSLDSENGPRLHLACAPGVVTLPDDQRERDYLQAQALAQLTAASLAPPVVQIGPGGSLRFATFELPVPTTAGADRLSRALWFMETYKALLHLKQPEVDMQLIRRSEDGQHLYFRQRINGLPVFPAELIIHQDSAGSITGVTGSYVPDTQLPTTPRLPAQTAEQLALGAVRGSMALGVTNLRYVNRGLLGYDDPQTRLAWQVTVGDSNPPASLYINADSGEVLLNLPLSVESFDLELNTGSHTGPYELWPCWDHLFITSDDQWFDENGPFAAYPDPTPPQPDLEGYRAYTYTQAVYNYWRNIHGRDSFNSKGQQIRVYVHAGTNWRNANFVYLCDIFQFGDGYATQDVIGHEFTHGVVDKSASLVYANQSGALNESFSDTFGHFVDNDDWLMGDGTPSGFFRDMSDPTVTGDADRMSDYWYTDVDNGGVHSNAGITNKAAYLIIQGDVFNSYTISGLGQAKAERLFYNVLTRRLTSSAQMIDLRNAMVAEASSLAANGQYGFTSYDTCQVQNAYAAVGLGLGDADCDGTNDIYDPDPDNDGVPDSKDNCPKATNSSQSDLDKDRQGDACDADIDGDAYPNTGVGHDNCPFVANPDQLDLDADGIGDACDDSDNDGFVDKKDNCMGVANPDQRDSDRDQQGDACDLDRDGDYVANESDNCPDRVNYDQVNRDGDGFGDACDLCPTTPSTDNSDPDKDGLANPCDSDDDNDWVLDAVDNCPLTYNPDQYDGNGNGIGLACDHSEQVAMQNGSPFVQGEIRFPSAPWPWRVQIPVCSDCPYNYLPEKFTQTIHVGLGTKFRARVVDSAGMPVVTSPLVSGQLDLTYQPAPYAAQPVQPGSRPAKPSAGLAPDQIGYWLELFPAEGTAITTTYPVTIVVDSLASYLYLPAVKR